MLEDYLVRGVAADGQIRAFAVNTTQLVQELQQRQRTLPVVSAALGRTATMAAIMGYMLKEEKHDISIQVVGDGPIGKMQVDVDGAGRVRGYVSQPLVQLPLNQQGKLDVAKAVGKGTIYIYKDLGLKTPYQGTSPIISGELGDDFTYYFAASEQIPSSVGLGVLVNKEQILAAGGYLIQVMPGAEEKRIDQLEERIQSMSSITEFLRSGATPEDLLAHLLASPIENTTKHPVRFGCRCSKEKVEEMLLQLGREEIESIRRELGKAEVVCHYCNKKYQFHDKELQEIIAKLN